MKKQIALIATLLCLFSATKAFSQCIISGGNLKAPLEYQTIEEVAKDQKKLLKAAKKGDLILKVPVVSSFRTEEDLRQLFHVCGITEFGRLFWPINYGTKTHDVWSISFSQRLELSAIKDLYFYIGRTSYDKLCITSYEGIITEEEFRKYFDKKFENRKAGYGFVTDEERDTTIAKINVLKNEYEEKVKKLHDTASKELLEENSKLEKLASDYESKKEWTYALFYYYKAYKAYSDKTSNEKDVIIEYNKRVRNLIEETKIPYYYSDRKQAYSYASELSDDNFKSYYSKYIEIKLSPTIDNSFKYEELQKCIRSGQPGFGKFSEFALHDEWKKLLMNAEKFATEFPPHRFEINKLKQKELDYKTKTATYTAHIDISGDLDVKYFNYDNKYEESNIDSLNIIRNIRSGYANAYRKDWSDLPSPKEWPQVSVTGLSATSNYTNGVAVYRSEAESQNEGYHGEEFVKRIFNAFAWRYAGCKEQQSMTLYDLKLNIVDRAGKELVKPRRVLVSTFNGLPMFVHGDDYKSNVEFTGISPEVMEKIDSGEARVNLVTVYLEYGTLGKNDQSYVNTGNVRAFIKDFKEVEIPISNVDYVYSDYIYSDY